MRLALLSSSRGLPTRPPPGNQPSPARPRWAGLSRQHTSGIADADGLDSATYSYQWLSEDAEIGGATGSTYTLVAGDEGQTIKVRVTVTDDAENETTLTSAATEAVEAAPQPDSPATGAPTITGTAQVGRTLTAVTSGIADADGLDSATYSYQWLSEDAEIGGATGSTYTHGGRRRGSDHQGAGHRHRRSWERDNADQRRHGGSGGSAPARQSGHRRSQPSTARPRWAGPSPCGTSGIADADGLDHRHLQLPVACQ